MEIKYIENTDEIISILTKVYSAGYIAFDIEDKEDLYDALTEKGYKLITSYPYPEYVRCIICDDYKKCRNFIGKKIILPNKIEYKIKFCDIILIDKRLEYILNKSLYYAFIWEFLTLEDINLRNYFTFKKSFYDVSDEIKNILMKNMRSFKDNLIFYFSVSDLIDENINKNNLLNYLEKTESLNDADKFFIYYYILSAYYVFTSKGKFVIMPVKGRYTPLGGLFPFKKYDYRDFRDIIENVKTSYNMDFLKTIAIKYKKINGRAELSVNSKLLKETLNIISDYSAEGFYKELLENGYL